MSLHTHMSLSKQCHTKHGHFDNQHTPILDIVPAKCLPRIPTTYIHTNIHTRKEMWPKGRSGWKYKSQLLSLSRSDVGPPQRETVCFEPVYHIPKSCALHDKERERGKRKRFVWNRHRSTFSHVPHQNGSVWKLKTTAKQKGHLQLKTHKLHDLVKRRPSSSLNKRTNLSLHQFVLKDDWVTAIKLGSKCRNENWNCNS